MKCVRKVMVWALAFCLAFACLPAWGATIAEVSTPLSDRSDAMLNNIDLAIDRLSGSYVGYGDAFSFNDVVGPRGAGQGYREAQNGRGSTVIAGGVSHVATTMYLAVMELGSAVVITEKKVYGDKFVKDYVRSGQDAIVTDYANGHDFCFVNQYGGFTISMWRDDRNIYCALRKEGSQDDFAPEPGYVCEEPEYFDDVEYVMYVYNCNDYVSLRSYPDTDSRRLITIPYGADVICHGEVRNGFYCVSYRGYTGYVLKAYLTTRYPSRPVSSSETAMYVDNCNEYISLREFPDTSARRLTTIPYCSRVISYGWVGNGFHKVSYRGYTGYALEAYLSSRPPASHLPDGWPMYVYNCREYVSLRSYPDTDSRRVTTIPYGAQVRCHGTAAAFYEVSYNGYTGYVLREYLTANW